MNSHNMYVYGELEKIIQELSPYHNENTPTGI